MNTLELWDYMVDREIATREELSLVTDIIGYSVESLLKVLYSKTGYNSIKQLED
ncbi:hypothetical protein HN682_03575 [Candidatus Peregrinibacteria bacterium]|jgi:hypothetical protein|nr:hypothetical protein [Candidatus Peregrinibacteria bacterium]